jgi:hypothetical protein
MASECYHWILRSYGSEQRLIQALFGSPQFTSWRGGSNALCVFLDSLDECLLRVDTIATLLADELSALPTVANLRLRIACRTADWPVALESGLKKCWGKDSFGAYELAPLTAEQVEVALNAHGISSSAFFAEIERREAASFAQKPLTLDLLINIWKRQNGRLPQRQHELYRLGCLALGEEQNQSRRSSRRIGSLSPDERFAIAAQIAAATMFSNRAAVWLGRRAEQLESDIGLHEIAAGKVKVNERNVPVTETALREVLGTGLFTARGPHRMGWAHQSFAEFLAAEFLAQNQISDAQISDLLFHPFGDEKKLVPQLRETAAWVAGARPTIFDHLMTHEPEALLASDLGAADGATKDSIVEALLTRVSADTLPPDDAITRRYVKLAHAGLARSLNRWIRDRNAASRARCEAIDIATACDLDKVTNGLVSLVLDPKEERRVRVVSAYRIAYHGSPGARRKLRGLALRKEKGDPDYELRGCALTACFPNFVTAKEVFTHLEPPPSEHIGAYHMFLSHRLIEKLKPRDLPIALAWVGKHSDVDGHDDELEELTTKILQAAVAHVHVPATRQGFAAAVFKRVSHFRELNTESAEAWRKWLSAHSQERREIVLEILDKLKRSSDADHLADYTSPLIVRDDFPWLIELLGKTHSRRLRESLSRLIWRTADYESASHVDAIVVNAKRYKELRTFFADMLEAWPLESERAKKAREQSERRQEWEAERNLRQNPPSRAEELNGYAVKHLDACESGKPHGWWKISRLFEAHDMGRFDNHGSLDLTELPGWKRADTAIHERVIRNALLFLRASNASPKRWFDERNVEYFPCTAGLRALNLLREHSSATYSQLTAEDWSRWMPAIVGHVCYNETKVVKRIARDAYTHAPRQFLHWLRRTIDRENRNGDTLFVLDRLPERFDSPLSNTLLRCADAKHLNPSCCQQLLTVLLKANVKGALRLVEKRLPHRLLKNGPSRDAALHAARLLMTHGEPGIWPRIWRLIKTDAAFGRAIISQQAHTNYHAPGGTVRALTANEIADLYIWLVGQFPPKEDPQHSGAHFVGGRESVATYRSQLVSHLADRGSAEACAALVRLAVHFPDEPWMRRVLLRGQLETRKHTWSPPTPNELIRLTSEGHSRFVQSTDQLFSLIEESLLRAQQRLQGETPLATQLWDGDRPKPEIELVKFVKDHLQRDLAAAGIIINREVEIHWRKRTDLQIEAVTPQPRGNGFDRLCVIIETKGCWNPELPKGLKNQLVERYLCRIPTQYGIYLIGNFLCDAWVDTDRKRRASIQLLKCLPALQSEAAKLLVEGWHVHVTTLDVTRPRQRKSGVTLRSCGSDCLSETRTPTSCSGE